LLGRPEQRAVVEVEHRVPPAPARVQHRARRRPRHPRRQRGRRDPEDGRLPRRLQVTLLELDLLVRGGGLAVEEEGRVVRRVHRRERERRPVLRMRADEGGVDAEAGERAADVLAEALLADGGDHGRAVAEPGRRDRDVGRAPADLLGVEIDADAADRQELEPAHVWTTPSSSCVSASSSAPPAISRTSCSRVTSALAWSPITRPRLSRTKWSPTGYAWCGLCVMKITPTPRSAARTT